MNPARPIALKILLILTLLLTIAYLGTSQDQSPFPVPDDPQLKLADSLANIGDYRGSLDMLYTLVKKKNGKDAKEKTFIYLKIAQAHVILYQFEKAEEYIIKSINELKNYQNDYLQSEVYYVLMLYHNQERAIEQVIAYADSAIMLKNKLYHEHHPELGKCYQILAALHFRLTGNNQLAELYYKKAENAILSSPDYPLHLKTLFCYYFSSFHMERGRLLPALNYAQQALNNAESLSSEQRNLKSYCYNLLANAHFYLEAYDEAIKYYHQALNLANPSDSRSIVFFYNNLGTNYYNKGDLTKSIFYYQKAIETVSEENSLERAVSDNKIGNIYLELGNLDSAAYLLNRSIHILNEFFPEETYEVASSNNLLAKYNERLGNDSLALQYYHKSICALVPELDANDVNAIPVCNQSMYANFIEEFLSDKAAFLSRYGLEKNDISSLHHSLSLYRLIDSIYLQKTDFLEIETSLHDIGHIHKTYGDALHLLFQLHEKQNEPKFLQLAYDFMERVKSGILLNQLVSLKHSRQLDIPDSLFRQEELLNTQLEEILYAYTGTLSKEEKLELDEEFAEVMAEKTSLLELMAENSPDYFAKRYQVNSVQIPQVQKELSSQNRDLLQFFWADEYLFALYFSEDKVEFLRMENSPDLVADIDQFVHLLRAGPDTEHFDQDIEKFSAIALKLYERLIEPAMNGHFPEKLLIIPDGPLSGIPFEALLTKKIDTPARNYANLPYLIKATAISYAYSTRTWMNAAVHDHNSKILGFSYSDTATFNPSNEQILPELAGAFAEINSLKTIFKENCRPFTGGEASKANFFAHFEDYGVLHLALHAESDPSIRQNSRIYFRPQKGDRDSAAYTLFAHELYQYSLNNRLVVLSACETGQGKQYIGEGIYSIARGFSYAGVPSVVMSLWPLSDQSGAKMISAFYQKLEKGQPLDQSLQSAKLAFLSSADEIAAHPTNWAALVSLGQQPSIFTKSFFGLNTLIIFVLAFIFMVTLLYKIRRRFQKS